VFPLRRRIKLRRGHSSPRAVSRFSTANADLDFCDLTFIKSRAPLSGQTMAAAWALCPATPRGSSQHLAQANMCCRQMAQLRIPPALSRRRLMRGKACSPFYPNTATLNAKRPRPRSRGRGQFSGSSRFKTAEFSSSSPITSFDRRFHWFRQPA